MNALLQSSIADWLQFEKLAEPGLFKTAFQVHHLGNVFIRSLHGGVTAAMMEMAAQHFAQEKAGSNADLVISSSSVDYLRITRDSDLFARATIRRLSRRLAVVDVLCWQDSEDVAIARGVITIKIDRP